MGNFSFKNFSFTSFMNEMRAILKPELPYLYSKLQEACALFGCSHISGYIKLSLGRPTYDLTFEPDYAILSSSYLTHATVTGRWHSQVPHYLYPSNLHYSDEYLLKRWSWLLTYSSKIVRNPSDFHHFRPEKLTKKVINKTAELRMRSKMSWNIFKLWFFFRIWN